MSKSIKAALAIQEARGETGIRRRKLEAEARLAELRLEAARLVVERHKETGQPFFLGLEALRTAPISDSARAEVEQWLDAIKAVRFDSWDLGGPDPEPDFH